MLPKLLLAGCFALLLGIFQISNAVAQPGYRLNRPDESGFNTGRTRFQNSDVPEFAPAQHGSRNAVEVKVAPRTLGLGKGVIDSFSSPQRPLAGVVNDFANNPEMKIMLRLKDHDVAVVVDKSSSMRTIDCFGVGPFPVSRWEWVRGQSSDLASVLSKVPGATMSLVLFDSKFEDFENAPANSISQIFNMVKPGSGTNPTAPIRAQLERFFKRRAADPNSRPLVIACITDGAPTNPDALKELLIETTHKIRGNQDVSVTFFQVGNDPDGIELLPELDRGLIAEGATCDMVSVRYFGELMRTGLARALAETVVPSPAIGRY